MRNKILSLALALCMIAVVFTALPTKAAVYYTGDVQTMDNTGVPKDVFFRGDHVFVNVTLFYESVLVNADIRVDLIDQNGVIRSQIFATTGDPADGYYNSTSSVPVASLNTNGVPISGDTTVCDIVLYVENVWWWDEVLREQIVLRETGLTLSPPSDWYYYPGQEITITVTTSNTDSFYVQILNETDDFLVPSWVYQVVDDTGVWTETFTIPTAAKDGEYLVEVRAEASDALWFSDGFYVAKYVLMLDNDRWGVLPGETVEVEYMVIDMALLTLYREVAVEWSAVWYNMTGDEQLETGDLVPSYFGTQEFSIPVDINLTSDYTVHFYANDTAGRSMETSMTFSIELLGGDAWSERNTYLAGEVVTIGVAAWAGGDELPGADVDITVEKDASAIAAYGVSNLVTGTNGMVEHEFTLDANALAGTYVVTATISKVGYSVVRMATFDIDLEYGLEVELDKDMYYSGETANVTFTTTWGVEEVLGNSVFYIVYSSEGNVAVGNTTSGMASFPIPEGYVGDIEIDAVTIVNGYFLEAWDEAWVQKAYIAVAPVVDVYSGGDTVQWNFEILTMMTTGMLSYMVEDLGGDMVASASMNFTKSGVVSYTVPMDGPSERYTVTVSLKDGLGNNVEASSSVWLEAEYTITTWLVSDSGYVTRAYEPGDKIEFAYEITTNGAAHRSIYKIVFYTSVDYIEMSVLTTSTSGRLSLTIPGDATDGDYGVSISLYDGVSNTWLAGDWLQFDVLSDQSGWSRSIGGMSAIDFTILVLIIVIVVMLVLVPFLQSRSGSAPKPKSEPAMMPPEQPPEPPQ